MLGDRMDTDILFGFQAGIDTCLVMSGCTESQEQIYKSVEGDERLRPTFILKSLDSNYF